MSTEENKQLVRRYFEDARLNPAVCDEIFAPSFCFHTIQHTSNNCQEIQSNPESEKAAYQWLMEVWSAGWHLTMDEVIAENDRVMVQWTFYGTQQGEYYGLPATHKPVVYSGINIFRIEASRIAEIWDISDRLWLWQQLGVLPDLKEAIARARAQVDQG